MCSANNTKAPNEQTRIELPGGYSLVLHKGKLMDAYRLLNRKGLEVAYLWHDKALEFAAAMNTPPQTNGQAGDGELRGALEIVLGGIKGICDTTGYFSVKSEALIVRVLKSLIQVGEKALATPAPAAGVAKVAQALAQVRYWFACNADGLQTLEAAGIERGIKLFEDAYGDPIPQVTAYPDSEPAAGVPAPGQLDPEQTTIEWAKRFLAGNHEPQPDIMRGWAVELAKVLVAQNDRYEHLKKCAEAWATQIIQQPTPVQPSMEDEALVNAIRMNMVYHARKGAPTDKECAVMVAQRCQQYAEQHGGKREAELLETLEYVWERTYIDRNGNYQFKDGFDLQIIIDAVQAAKARGGNNG